MKNLPKFISAALVLGFAVAQAQETTDQGIPKQECSDVVAAITDGFKGDLAKFLELVEKQIKQSPECAGEAVKAAIETSKANNEVVGLIVETAVGAAPGQTLSIEQSATTAAPLAGTEINAAIVKAGGTPSGFNPLSFPGDVEGGDGVNGGDLNSGGGAGEIGKNNSQVNQQSGDGTPVVTNPNP